MATNEQVDASLRVSLDDLTAQGVKSIENRLMSFGKKMLGGAGVIYALNKVAQGINYIMSEALEAEVAVNRLEQAMQGAGTYTAQASKEAQDYAKQLQKTTIYTDEAVMSAQTYLISLNKLTGEGLNQATLATANLATRLKIDLDSAAKLVSKGLSGNVAMFQRYGIHISASTDKAQQFKNVMEGIASIAGGAAASEVNTLEGGLTKLKNRISEGAENIGGALIPVLNDLIGALNKSADAADKLFDENWLAKRVRNFRTGMNFLQNGLLGLWDKFTNKDLPTGFGPDSNLTPAMKKLADAQKKINEDYKKSTGQGTAGKGGKGGVGGTPSFEGDSKNIGYVKELTAKLKIEKDLQNEFLKGFTFDYTKTMDNLSLKEQFYRDTSTNTLIEGYAVSEEAHQAYLAAMEANYLATFESIKIAWGSFYSDQKDLLSNFATAFKNIWKQMMIDYISGQEQGVIASTAKGIADAVASKNWLAAAQIGAQGAASMTLMEGAKGTIAGLATGGIVRGDGIYRLGEQNKQEAVIPLETPAGRNALSNAMSGGSSTQDITLNIDGVRLAKIMTNKQAQVEKQRR